MAQVSLVETVKDILHLLGVTFSSGRIRAEKACGSGRGKGVEKSKEKVALISTSARRWLCRLCKKGRTLRISSGWPSKERMPSLLLGLA